MLQIFPGHGLGALVSFLDNVTECLAETTYWRRVGCWPVVAELSVRIETADPGPVVSGVREGIGTSLVHRGMPPNELLRPGKGPSTA